MNYEEKILLVAGIVGLILGASFLLMYMFKRIPFVKFILSGLSAVVILLVLALSVWAILQSTGIVSPIFLDWLKKITSK
ncbi:hypothetical protein [Mesoplasma seiffertii]|uniref:hypothetical protein n=1 Tax=Mesoplasma seiffertii TaxID=28224 RepID=UPI00047B03E5|nr:hypothetical protein [Mesoplasma seiffertii]